MDGKEYNWKEDVRDFLGGYFHQDVDDAYEALDEFIEECSREGKKRTLLNIGVWTEKRGFYTLRKEIRIFLDFDYSKLLNIFVYFGQTLKEQI